MISFNVNLQHFKLYKTQTVDQPIKQLQIFLQLNNILIQFGYYLFIVIKKFIYYNK